MRLGSTTEPCTPEQRRFPRIQDNALKMSMIRGVTKEPFKDLGTISYHSTYKPSEEKEYGRKKRHIDRLT